MNAFNTIDSSSSDEEESSGRAFHISETNSSSPSSVLPSALHSGVNAELLRMILSHGHLTPPPTTESLKNALHENIMAMLCSQRNSQPAPSSAFAVNTMSQLRGASGATTYPMTTTPLYPGERHMMSVLRSGDASLQAPSLMPNGTMTTSIEQQLNALMQQRRVQQAIAAITFMNAASHNPSIRLNEPRQFQPPPSLELLQFLTQGKRDRVMTSDTLLQAQAHSRTYAGLQANIFSSGNLAQDRATQPVTSAAPTMTPIAIPQPYGRNGEAESFPGKLYRLLAEVERKGNTHIVSFTPDEKAFMIHDRDAFMNDVAPRYFRQSRFTSFVRQLNLYGFGRLSYGPNRGGFAHPQFLRGRPELVEGIQRSPQGRKARIKPCDSCKMEMMEVR